MFSSPPQRDARETQEWIPGPPDDLERLCARFHGEVGRVFRAGDGSTMICSTVLHQKSHTIVRLVAHEAFDRILVGKFFNGDPSDMESIARFRHEADMLSMLDGRDIPHVRGWGEHEGRPYILMDFISGVSLQAITDAADGRSLPLPVVKHIGAELASVLASIHEVGVVHRDIKPGNIILRDDGGISIIDFGLACRRRGQELRLTHEGQTMGTPRYLAPESLEGSRDASPASDIYGLGLVLTELALGRHPMSDDQVYALKAGRMNAVEYSAVCRGAAREVSQKDRFFGEYLSRMFDADPSERPTATKVVEAFAGMPLERYGAHSRVLWTLPAVLEPCPIPSAFGVTEDAAAHAMLEAIQRVSAVSTRRRFIATAGAVGLVAAIGGTGATVLWNLFSENENRKEYQRVQFNPFDRIGKRPEEGVEVSTRDGEPCAWVFRLSTRKLQTLGIERAEQHDVLCTLFYRENTSFLFVPGKGIHPLGEATEADIARILRTLPLLDGPITIPPGFPGDEASWRSTVNGRLRMLREQQRSPLPAGEG